MKKLPEEFLEKTISLKESLGVSDLAWEYDNIIEVINFIKRSGYVILGGDVLVRNKESINYTYDNWHYDVYNSLESCDYALNYIQKYPKKEQYIYCLVIA